MAGFQPVPKAGGAFKSVRNPLIRLDFSFFFAYIYAVYD
jgi:hypothetical protein